MEFWKIECDDRRVRTETGRSGKWLRLRADAKTPGAVRRARLERFEGMVPARPGGYPRNPCRHVGSGPLPAPISASPVRDAAPTASLLTSPDYAPLMPCDPPARDDRRQARKPRPWLREWNISRSHAMGQETRRLRIAIDRARWLWSRAGVVTDETIPGGCPMQPVVRPPTADARRAVRGHGRGDWPVRDRGSPAPGWCPALD